MKWITPQKSFLVLFFLMNFMHSQGQELKLELPEDYLAFLASHKNKAFDFYFKIDNWHFFDLTTAKEKTKEQRDQGKIGQEDFVFAQNASLQWLIYQKEGAELSSKIYLLDREGELMFYAFSISEFSNFETTTRLIEEIETKGFEQQDISAIKDCAGSLYEYAFALNTSEYDDNFSEARNKKALALFFEAAERGHPSAAHEIASYYYFQEDTDIDKVIEWREKAIAFGSMYDRYELADFLIDYKIEKIDRAVELLEELAASRFWRANSAKLKLARIYMRGTGGKKNYERGLLMTRAAADNDNYNAYSDLAFYYYKGIGVEKDLALAHELLVKANKMVIKKTGDGMWEEFIAQLEKELKLQNQADGAEMRLHDIWVLESIRGETIDLKQKDTGLALPQLEPRVKEMEFYGNDSCNDIFGKFEKLDKQFLKFGAIGGTKKLCADNDLANKFVNALKEVQQYRIEKLKLYLLDQDGKELLRLKKVD